jgi:hypothetical protein
MIKNKPCQDKFAKFHKFACGPLFSAAVNAKVIKPSYPPCAKGID